MNKLVKTSIAEILGTLVFVLFGCSVCVATYNGLTGQSDLIATSLAFGMAYLAMYYCFSKVSGAQFNPITTVALLINKKITVKEAIVSIVSQIVGAIIAILGVYLVTNQRANLAANQTQMALTYTRDTKSMQYLIAFLVELIMSFVLIYVTLAAKAKDEKLAGIIIGFAIVLITLLGLKVTLAGANPARSIACAIFQKGNDSLKQLWIFILAPVVGSVLAAFAYKFLNKEEQEY